MSDEQATDTTQTETTATEAAATAEATSETVATETAAADDAGSADASTVLGAATAEDGAGDAESKDAAADKDAVAEAVVPESYDLKLTVAGEDGKDQDIAIDTELLEAATPTFKELKLTNEEANKLLPLVPKIQEQVVKQLADNFAVTCTQWAKEAQDDPEIGGRNWKTTKDLCAKAIDHFMGPSKKDAQGNETNPARVFLDQTGTGNNPHFIRAWRKVGEGLAEDGTLARGSEGPRAKPSRLEALYPDDVKK